MKISAVRTVVVGNPWKNWVFVLVETDEGIIGLGEGSANGFARTIEAAVHELKPLIIGQDPTRIEWLTRRLLRDVYTDGGQIHRSAVAGLEIACWDLLLGQSLGVPVWQLLGGLTRDRVRAYANGWYRTERAPDAIVEAAVATVKHGFTALKIDPSDRPGECWRMPSSRRRSTSSQRYATRSGRPSTSWSKVTRGSRSTRPRRWRGNLEPFQPMWFEEPVRHDRVGAVAEVARRSPVPIATGESFHTLGEFAELGAAGGVAFWQPEAAHLGGLGNLRAAAVMAEAYDGLVAPHQAGGPVATAVCLTLAACTNNHVIQEFFDPFNEPWAEILVDWSPQLDKDGCLPIPTTPGIGVSLNLDAVARRPYADANALHIFEDAWEKRRRS